MVLVNDRITRSLTYGMLGGGSVPRRYSACARRTTSPSWPPAARRACRPSSSLVAPKPSARAVSTWDRSFTKASLLR
eukprot:2177413-Prymnesium_polylepis.2